MQRLKLHYRLVGLIFWLVAGLLPLSVLLFEFRPIRMGWDWASAYAGQFLFPATFLWLILLCLERPTLNYLSHLRYDVFAKDAGAVAIGVSVAPVFGALMLTILATSTEYFGDSSIPPWYISPNPDLPSLEHFDGKQEVNQFLDSKGYHAYEDKEWPAFYRYLIVSYSTLQQLEPVHAKDPGFIQAQATFRRDQGSFMQLFTYDLLLQEGIDKSWTSLLYQIAFPMIVFVAAFGTFLIAFFVPLSLAGKLNRNITDETFLGLTITLLCFVIWFPMRMHTIDVKAAMFGDGIRPTDLLGAVTLTLAAVGLAVSWLRPKNDYVLGTLALVSPIASVVGPRFLFPDAFAKVLADPFAYATLSVLLLIPLYALLLHYRYRERRLAS